MGGCVAGFGWHETVLINQILPGEKFLDCEHIMATGFFER